ncbi:8-oxoguanine deaminase [Myxococcota bacterium]|nr:8-oxoguanine deaminase [Myxococcota bacterium]MBU1535526.1 8-oxoguanine deaminase [Myxococcota bacterium]
MKTLIKNCMEVALCDETNRILQDCDILLNDNRIEKVGHSLPDHADTIVDGSGKVAIPGMVNTHHHLYQTLFRNIPKVQNVELFDWLVNLYQGWRHITPEAVKNAAMTGLGELLLTGCTLASDHHYLFPSGYGEEIIHAEVEAARELGIRFYPTRGSMSRGVSKGGLPPDDVVQDEETILARSADFIKRFHDPSPGAMLRGALAPCSPFSVTTELLRESATLARSLKVRLHTHLCETKDEEDYCLSTVGMRPLDYMESVGWLGNDVWYAHGIWFNDEEIKRLGKTGTGVAHCPTSNLRLGSGICNVVDLRAAGAPVGLAVDGSASNDASDMLAEARLALLIHRIGPHGIKATNTKMVLEMATRGGARVLGWDDELGSIKPGYLADIALFDMHDISYAGGLHDPTAALVFCNSRSRAHTVFVNGKVVVKEGHLVNADEDAIIEKQNALAKKILERASADINLLEYQ